jgi:pimeloyl-ACP methyl ester carboxylesterase
MAAAGSSVTVGGGLTLSYTERGDGSELALVLLPGPTDSWRSYQPVLQQLPLSVRTIAVSQRGHGDSDKPTAGYRVEDFAADVPPLLDALGIERAVLVGHSGSCLVARRVAIDHPNRVAGLVLEASPSTLHDDPRLTEFIETVVSSLADQIDPAFARSFVVDTSSAAVAPDVQDQLTAEALKVPARVWRETFAGLLAYDDLMELGRITAPVLLIWGDADGLVGREMQEELLQRLSSATLVSYPGIGHTPRWEDPHRFASDMAAFVQRVRTTEERASITPG